MIRESGVASCSCGRAGRALLLYLNYLPSHLYCTELQTMYVRRRTGASCFFGGGEGGIGGLAFGRYRDSPFGPFLLFPFPPSLPSLASSSFLRMESRFMITAYLRCMYSGHNGSAPRQTDWSYHLPDHCVKRFFFLGPRNKGTRGCMVPFPG